MRGLPPLAPGTIKNRRCGVYPRLLWRNQKRASNMHFIPAKKIRLPLDIYRRGHIFFLTITTHARWTWFEKFPDLAETAVNTLVTTCRQRHSSLYAWCVMPNHVHILVCDDDIVALVRLFKGRMTPSARALLPSRTLWQRSFFDHALRREESLLDVAGYIFENPVRSDLVDGPNEYPFTGSEVWPEWRNAYC